MTDNAPQTLWVVLSRGKRIISVTESKADAMAMAAFRNNLADGAASVVAYIPRPSVPPVPSEEE